MKQTLTTLLTATALMLTVHFAFADAPLPGTQTAQSIELPKNMAFRARQTEEQRTAERARRDALSKEARDAEDKERRFRSFEDMKNPKPLSETEKETVNYWLFLPNDYKANTGKKYPLLLFLHGSGERGSDIDKVKIHGPPKLLADSENIEDWKFITVSPQCPEDYGWSPQQLGLLLDDLEKRYAVDKNRIYVTGLSMGGFGTWGLLYHFPDRFAAGVPICGGFNPAAADRYKEIPLWVFHGAKDSAVKVELSIDMVNAIKAVGGKQVQLTIYPDLEHDSWTVTYENSELYRWLLKQKRKNSVDVRNLRRGNQIKFFPNLVRPFRR